MRGPYFSGAVSRLCDPTWRVYGALYLHPTTVKPNPSGLLAQRAPLGVNGEIYGDATVGVEGEKTDRWPMPMQGWHGEVDARVGATLADASVHPLVGVHTEIIGWHPIIGKFVIGGRLAIEKSFGDRPMQEQFNTGGRFRDETGLDESFSGYGRIRTRGDGMVAAELELRPFLFDLHPKKWDLQGYLSLYAEQGWLFVGNDAGPPMPTLGAGPELLWQKGSQLRPYISFGWRSDTLGGKRYPVPQYGLSIVDPL